METQIPNFQSQKAAFAAIIAIKVLLVGTETATLEKTTEWWKQTRHHSTKVPNPQQDAHHN